LNTACLGTICELPPSGRDRPNHLAAVPFACASGSLRCLILFQAELVPRRLSSWGIGGAAPAGAASLPLFSRAVDDPNRHVRSQAFVAFGGGLDIL